MNPQMSYQASMARINDLHREAAKCRGALEADGRRHAWPRALHLPGFSFRPTARGRLA